jgi:predicted nuclease with TOPRIM domain
MTDPVDLTQLAVLQRIDEKLDRVIDDVRELKLRLDRLEDRLDRNGRLELVDSRMS